MPVRNKAAMATASATAVLVLLVPLLTGGGGLRQPLRRCRKAEASLWSQKRQCNWKVPFHRHQ